MRRSLHHLRKGCQHYEVNIQVPSPNTPQSFTHPCHFLTEKPWARGWFQTTIVGSCDKEPHPNHERHNSNRDLKIPAMFFSFCGDVIYLTR